MLGVIAGFLAGVAGGAFNLNGPFIVLYCSIQYKEKEIIKSLMAAYFFIAGLYICSLLSLRGLVNLTTLKYFAILAPILITGIFIGHHFYDKINHSLFKKIIYSILIITGILLTLK